MEPSSDPRTARSRVPELDGLRGLAILTVLVYHYFAIPWRPPPGPTWAWTSKVLLLGWSGVDLFFVLSGFLIGGILLDARKSPGYFRVFYLRRACRILPIYALTLGAVASVPMLRGGVFPWWTYATFTQNVAMARAGAFGAVGLAVTWSLAIEEQFYLTLPPLIRWLSPTRVVLLGIGTILAAPALRALLYLGGWTMAPYFLMPCRADALMIGVVAAWSVRAPTVRAGLVQFRHGLTAAAVIGAVGAALLARWRPGFTSFRMITFGYSWLGLWYGVVLLIAVTNPDHLISRALRLRPLRALGSIAYGVYLIHLIALVVCTTIMSTWLRSLPLRTVGSTTLALGVTLLLAQCSWTWFERPIVRHGHRYQY